MSTNQSNKNLNKNKLVLKENTHNIASLCYFILVTLFVILLLIISFIDKDKFMIGVSSVALFFLFIKIFIQTRFIIGFKKLKESSSGEESINFYITKS